MIFSPRVTAIAWLLLAAVACRAGKLHAQPTAAHPGALGIPIDVDPCVPVDVPSFQRQLAIELEAALQTSDLERAQQSAHITLSCRNDQIAVEIEDAIARKTWRRKVELRGVDPSAHTRLLALSVAELLLASWLEQRVDPLPVHKPPAPWPQPQPTVTPPRETPPVRPAHKPPAPWEDPRPSTTQPSETRETSPATSQPLAAPETAQPRPQVHVENEPPHPAEPSEADPTSAASPALPVEEPQAEAPRLQLGAAANLLAFASSLAPIPGGQLHVSVPLSASWALHGAAQAGHGSLSGTLLDEQGRTDASVQITTASLALSLHALTRVGDFELSLGAGVRLGFVHLAGGPIDRPLEPARAFAPWTGPLLSPRVSYRLSRGLLVTLSAEAGWMAVRVRVLAPRDAVLTDLHGAWMLLSLGLDLSFLP